MNDLKNKFEDSLKKYKGDKAEILVIETFTNRLLKELPTYFSHWINPKFTLKPIKEPISKIKIEVDSRGDLYTSIFNIKGKCLESDASGPSLYDWGIVSVDEKERSLEKRIDLIAQFLAICYQEVLPSACKTTEFQNLPREEHITFSVGAHSGWECDNLYVHTGERYEIN